MNIKQAQKQLEKTIKEQAQSFREISDKILVIMDKNPKVSKKRELLLQQAKEIVEDVMEIRPITVKFTKKYEPIMELIGFKRKEKHG